MTKRLRQFGICALITLSMLAASVAACACSHHAVKVEATVPSCHSSSHESMSAADNKSVDTDAPVVDESCTCYVNLPTPLIASNKAQRVAKIEKQVADIPNESDVAIVELAVTTPVSVRVETEPPFYISILRRAGPSRAPPRL